MKPARAAAVVATDGTAAAIPVASDRKTHLDGVAIGLMLVCCVLWGMQQALVKATLPEVPPFAQAAIRSLGATVLVWGWSLWRGIPLFDRDGTLGAGLFVGVLFGLEVLCIYASLPLTDASRVTVFIYTAPFVVALLLPRFVAAEKLDAVQFAGLACALVAVAWAFQEGFTSPKRSQWLGDGLALLAAVLWGLTTLLIRATRLSTAVAEKTLFYQLGVSGVLIASASWATGETWSVSTLSTLAWTSIVFQTLIVAFASYLAWFWLLRHYPATRLSAFSFLTPMFGLVFAAVALGEAITVRIVVALVCVAIGIWFVNAPKSRRRRSA